LEVVAREEALVLHNQETRVWTDDIDAATRVVHEESHNICGGMDKGM
jgi:hypothetical protein